MERPRQRTALTRPLLAICTVASIISFSVLQRHLSLTVSLRPSSPPQLTPASVILTDEQLASLDRCASLRAVPGPDPNFLLRGHSDRYEPGTPATLIKNATLWTGARNGTEIVYGDILLEHGLVRAIGYIPEAKHTALDTVVVDAHGGWVTPGLVDMHSHIGIVSAPATRGASLGFSSPNGPVAPWLRSVDGFDTHDAGFALAAAGGVTAMQVLPGSENAIAGQAFVFKPRPTAERSPTSMLVEPPYELNGTAPRQPFRWRHLKQACGENLAPYGGRMDTAWAFREAYAAARAVRDAQDAFCAAAEAGRWADAGARFPEELRWEALVDVLRGRVKVSTHCYEAVDLDALVRLSQEFEFPIASVHHASEAYLVPSALERMHGGKPTVAMFASLGGYKREAFRASPFAPRVLADRGFSVAMKSDHPLMNSRYLLYEAQQAHYYGMSPFRLPPHLALASVTTVPAAALGLSHRLGTLREGADADVVLWDAHPLQLGAAPRAVWIDGVLQVRSAHPAQPERTTAPIPPNWDRERATTLKHAGLPPLQPNATIAGRVAFTHVKEVYVREGPDVVAAFDASDFETDDVQQQEGTTVIVERGRVTCVGRMCQGEERNAERVVDLHGGAVSPGLMTYGSPLGLVEMDSEPSTGDGPRFDALRGDAPKALGDVGAVVRVADALKFGTRYALAAHRAGVTYATTSFAHFSLVDGDALIAGVSATFRTSAQHSLERTAIVKHATALHVSLGRAVLSGAAGVSTQVAALRRLLLNGADEGTETGRWFKKAANGDIPLVIDVASADVMATLIRLKDEIEEKRGSYMRMVFARATEAHLLARELGEARIGVILMPARPYPMVWDERRIIPGPPLTNDTALATLLRNKVVVALGVSEATLAPHARFDAGWASVESGGWITKRQAHELVSANLEKLLDLQGWIGDEGDLVAFDGGSGLGFAGKPFAIASPGRGLVEIL